jgi:hypothetical protein
VYTVMICCEAPLPTAAWKVPLSLNLETSLASDKFTGGDGRLSNLLRAHRGALSDGNICHVRWSSALFQVWSRAIWELAGHRWKVAGGWVVDGWRECRGSSRLALRINYALVLAPALVQGVK